MALHRNAQRLLKPLRVYHPYAEQLSFIGWQTRYRRDHQKYLTLIDTIALLHQYQREVKIYSPAGRVASNASGEGPSCERPYSIQYLEVTRHDIALANRIADWALGRSIDELPGPTRRLLIELYDWVRGESEMQKIIAADFTFTRRQVRKSLHWSTSPLRIHLERLCQHEYVISHGRSQGMVRYSLLYDGAGREGQPSLLGLVDAASLVEPESNL